MPARRRSPRDRPFTQRHQADPGGRAAEQPVHVDQPGPDQSDGGHQPAGSDTENGSRSGETTGRIDEQQQGKPDERAGQIVGAGHLLIGYATLGVILAVRPHLTTARP